MKIKALYSRKHGWIRSCNTKSLAEKILEILENVDATNEELELVNQYLYLLD